MNEKINKKLKLLPKGSGVYIMLDRHNTIIYIGKAKNLKARVNQYFSLAPKNKKTMLLVSEIADFEYILTNSELEALVLENSLIKLHQPFYNVLLKDDKTYPYLKIHINDDFPWIEIVRVVKKDGSLYFGPYMSGITASGLLDIIQSIFPIRGCKGPLPLKKDRGCLKSFIGTCSAPCVKAINKADYDLIVKNVISFLSGKDKYVKEELKRKIEIFSNQEDFETAIEYRDKLQMLDKLEREQVVDVAQKISVDVFVRLVDKEYGVITVLNVRHGSLIGVQNIQTYNLLEDSDVLSSYISQYYEINPILVKEIIIYPDFEFKDELQDHLSEIRGNKVKISYPKAGIKKQLLSFALNNAKEYLSKVVVRSSNIEDLVLSSLRSLKEDLGLPTYPRRIECYDISNFGASDKVASMVVFLNGLPNKKHYRKFRIKNVKGVDDYASMFEVLTRRMESLASNDVSFVEKPDLIIIDGGRGHLSTVSPVILKHNIPFIALAEKNEDIYLWNNEKVLNLDKDSNSLKLLQRVRDEAHRFANKYQSNLQMKKMLSSNLTGIRGIGEVHSKALFNHFKTIEAISKATIDDLMKVPGIGRKKAKEIKSFFENKL